MSDTSYSDYGVNSVGVGRVSAGAVVPLGWQCPVCGQVMAPTVAVCPAGTHKPASELTTSVNVRVCTCQSSVAQPCSLHGGVVVGYE